MKKIYALSLFLPLAFCMSAKQLSPQEAINRLNLAPTRGGTTPAIDKSPVFTLEKEGFVSLYVFNQEDSGYLIVSADDCAIPLLGYSDSGEFDADNIPSNLQWWLDFYAREIKYATQNNIKLQNVSTRSDFSPIAPMVSTKWNQGSPYNNDCPKYNGSKSVTGCVATAMAQAMNYHQWPVTGTGKNSYTWNGQTLRMNFESVTFDWAHMTDTYGSSSTQEEIDAVAELMYACGISVNMQYTSNESGASSYNIGPALYNYFGYSSDMVMPSRAFYSTSDWQEMVYNQLANGMPVLYGGQSNDGGHEFVCDGYSSDGYFHFNWGWAGLSDGYYLLSALDPMSQGIGGSTSGFNYDQGIVVNMLPSTKTVTTQYPAIYCYGDFTTSTTEASAGDQVEFTSGGAFYNFGVKTIDATLGIKVVDSNGKAQYYPGTTSQSYEVLSGYTSFNVNLPTNLSSGTYLVSPAYKTSDSSIWLDCPLPLSVSPNITMTVNNGTISFATTSPKISVTDMNINPTIYLNTNFKATFNIQNNDETEYYAELMFGLIDSSGQEVTESYSAVTVDLAAGETKNVDFITEFSSQIQSSNGSSQTLQPGTYTLVLFDMISGNVVYEYPETINLTQAPTNTQLQVLNFGLANGGSVVTDPANIEFTGSVECVEGYYGDQLIVAVFEKGATSTSLTGSTDYLFLAAGQSANFNASVALNGASEGEEYFAAVFDSNSKQLSNAVTFTIGSAGVNEIMDSSAATPEYYNLNGVRVSGDNLRPGLYIVKQGNQTRKIMIPE